MKPDGSRITPVVVNSKAIVRGNKAIPVYLYSSVPQGQQVYGRVKQVRYITAGDLVENGGKYQLEGRIYAMPIVVDTSGQPPEGDVIAVYIANSL